MRPARIVSAFRVRALNYAVENGSASLFVDEACLTVEMSVAEIELMQFVRIFFIGNETAGEFIERSYPVERVDRRGRNYQKTEV